VSSSPLRVYCENQVVVHVTENRMFHGRTKNIDIDCHLVLQKVGDDKVIRTRFVSSANKQSNLFTKPLDGFSISIAR